MSPQEFERLRQESTVLDLRTEGAYWAGHLPGAVSAPRTRSDWANAVYQWWETEGRPSLLLFGDDTEAVTTAARELGRCGIMTSGTWDGGVDAFREMGLQLAAIADISVEQLAEERGRWRVLDVREPHEWNQGIVPDAVCLPLSQLSNQLACLDPVGLYAVVCASGNRSRRASLFLSQQGFQVHNVVGGMKAWMQAGFSVRKP